eukprot:scaffold63366_cov17-Tisochrysis_lutea.AAC.1
MHRDDAFNHDLTLTGPRCCSTSLMYAFAQREDTVAYDEPLYARCSGCTMQMGMLWFSTSWKVNTLPLWSTPRCASKESSGLQQGSKQNVACISLETEHAGMHSQAP